MKKPRSVAEDYLNGSAVSLFDVLFALAVIVSLVIFFINFWVFAPLLVSVVLLILSRSAHVSDKEYEKLLKHHLIFNSVRDARSEEYEKLFTFFEQGYVAEKALGEFYIGAYDLSVTPIRYGEDKEWRSALYHLSHLKFSEGRLDVYTILVNVVDGTVTAEQYALRLTTPHEVKPVTVNCRTGQKTVHFLTFPDCPQIPVTENSEELEAILSNFPK